MKLVLQVAGGIVLAALVLFALAIMVAVGPAFGGFLGAVVNAPDFPVVLLLVAVVTVVVVWLLALRPRG